MRVKFEQARAAFTSWYSTLSSRERLVVIFGVTALLIWASGKYLYDPVRAAFAEQGRMLEELEGDAGLISNVNVLLSRNATLVARKAEIEDAYKQVQNLGLNETSHIEELVKRVAGVQNQPAINNTGTTPLGDQYETASFSVKFQTSNFPKLIEFLFELVNGKRPLILSKLVLNKRPNLNALDVELEVSSLRPVENRPS